MRLDRGSCRLLAVLLLVPSAAAAQPAVAPPPEPSRDERIGFMYETLVEDQLPVLADEGAQRAVERIVDRLDAAGKAGHPPHRLHVRVLLDPVPNLFSGPRSLYITTGLLDILGSEDELAAALAPEVVAIAAAEHMDFYHHQLTKKHVIIGVIMTGGVVALFFEDLAVGTAALVAPSTGRLLLGDALNNITTSLGLKAAEATLRVGKVEDPKTELANRIAALSNQRRQALRRGLKEQAERLRQEIELLESNQQALISLAREIFPADAAVRYPLPLGVGDLGLTSSEALLRYEVLPDRLLRWLIKDGKVVAFDAIRKDAGELRQEVQTYDRALHGLNAAGLGEDQLKLGRRLYQLLVGDLAPRFQGEGKVFITAGDVLETLPFEALVESYGAAPRSRSAKRKVHYLGDDVGLVYAYSASSLTAMRKRAGKRPAAQKPLLVVAVSDFSPPPAGTLAAGGKGGHCTIPSLRSDQPERDVASWAEALGVTRLPQVGPFARDLGKLFPDSVSLVEQDASEARLRQQHFLEQFKYIAFATHGTSGRPPYLLEPGLLLSPRGADLCDADNDGLLSMSDIMSLNLAADAVLLTACDTAASETVLPGEGALSVARAFQSAGASSVVGALWPLNEASALLFSQRFLSYLGQGRSRLDAFRQARRDLRAGAYPQVGNWAPFIFIGEP